MSKKIAFLVSINLLFPFHSFSQDLSMAALSYFYDNHFSQKPEQIAKSRIKSIESHWYNYSNDTIKKDLIIEIQRFNKFGKPEYSYRKPMGMEKDEHFFTYDSGGKLIKEEKYGIAPSLAYKLIEIHEWSYTKEILNRHRHYLLLDKMEVENGASYFPEKIFLFTNDTLIYSPSDTSVVVLTNHRNHCLDTQIELYPSSFKTPIKTTLKFHSNQKIRTKTTRRGSLIQTQQFDDCGNSIGVVKVNKRCQEMLQNQDLCLTPGKLYACNNADTITINQQLFYFVINHSSYFQHDSGAGTTYRSDGIAYYDQQFRLINSIDTSTSVKGSLWDNIPAYSTQTIRKSHLEYDENGLLLKISVSDETGRLLEVTENKVEYY